MSSLILTYLMTAGAISNGMKVVRHIGKAFARAVEGDFRKAGGELVTAIAAPADAVVQQAQLLAGEVRDVIRRARAEDEALERRGFLADLFRGRLALPPR